MEDSYFERATVKCARPPPCKASMQSLTTSLRALLFWLGQAGVFLLLICIIASAAKRPSLNMIVGVDHSFKTESRAMQSAKVIEISATSGNVNYNWSLWSEAAVHVPRYVDFLVREQDVTKTWQTRGHSFGGTAAGAKSRGSASRFCFGAGFCPIVSFASPCGRVEGDARAIILRHENQVQAKIRSWRRPETPSGFFYRYSMIWSGIVHDYAWHSNPRTFGQFQLSLHGLPLSIRGCDQEIRQNSNRGGRQKSHETIVFVHQADNPASPLSAVREQMADEYERQKDDPYHRYLIGVTLLVVGLLILMTGVGVFASSRDTLTGNLARDLQPLIGIGIALAGFWLLYQGTGFLLFPELRGPFFPFRWSAFTIAEQSGLERTHNRRATDEHLFTGGRDKEIGHAGAVLDLVFVRVSKTPRTEQLNLRTFSEGRPAKPSLFHVVESPFLSSIYGKGHEFWVGSQTVLAGVLGYVGRIVHPCFTCWLERNDFQTIRKEGEEHVRGIRTPVVFKRNVQLPNVRCALFGIAGQGSIKLRWTNENHLGPMGMMKLGLGSPISEIDCSNCYQNQCDRSTSNYLVRIQDSQPEAFWRVWRIWRITGAIGVAASAFLLYVVLLFFAAHDLTVLSLLRLVLLEGIAIVLCFYSFGLLFA